MPGFSKADCDAFTRDSLRHTVTWAGRSDLRKVPQPVRIRLYLRNAKVYSSGFAAR